MNWKREIFYYLLIFILAIGGGGFINQVLIVNAKIPSNSMEETIMIGDRLIALRTAYWFDDPQRGDIVVFEAPNDENKLYIKRVIGVPGDTVEGKDGKVILNGELLDEPYVKEEMIGDFEPYTVPEDSYFMMGDNRNSSHDSRAWETPYIKKDAILGKAVFRYYPNFTRFDSTESDKSEK